MMTEYSNPTVRRSLKQWSSVIPERYPKQDLSKSISFGVSDMKKKETVIISI